MTPSGTLGWSLPASGGVSGKALPQFRLRASDFLRRQKVTKDRLKDPWSLRISFSSKPVACLPLASALRAPTRPGPACCRPWAIEETFHSRRQGALRGWSLGRGRLWRDVSRFVVGAATRGRPAVYGSGVRHTPAHSQQVGQGLAPAALFPLRIGWSVAESPAAVSPEGE